jgi:hypothetical protein
MNKKIFLKNKKGVSVYLALMIMTILLAITFGLNAIIVGQIKTVRGIGYSVVSFYAAETGMEIALYTDNCTSTCSFSGYLDLNGNDVQDDDDSTYTVEGYAPGEDDCPSDMYYCLKSIGGFKEAKRALQTVR